MAQDTFPGSQHTHELLATRQYVDEGPRGVLGVAEVTSNQSVSGTTADVTGLSVTVDVPAGRRIRITGHGIMNMDSGERGIINIVEDGTTVGRAGDFTGRGTDDIEVYNGDAIRTPTAGSYTYKLNYQVVSGSGHLHAAAATAPAFILVEDIGPAT